MFLSTCHNPVLEDGPLGGRCLPCCGRRPNRADLYDPVHLCFTSSIPCLLLSVMDWRTTYPRDFCLTRSPTKGNEEASIHKANTSCICSVYRDLCEGILIQISSSKGELWRRENTDPVQPHRIHCAHRAPHMGMGLMVVWGLFFSGVGFKGSSHCIQISLLAGGIWLDWLLRTDFILWGAV